MRVLSFKAFITEEKVGTGKLADAAGKAFEIHTAKHIGHILKGAKGNPEHHYPKHFSDESGDDPKSAIEKVKARLGDALHAEIDHHARRMAYHLIGHMKNRGHDLDHTTDIHWTSKPKDLERLTGKKGIKGTADVAITHKGKHHGVSLKYSQSGGKPSLRSPGIKDLNKHLEADNRHVFGMIAQHHRTVEKHVGKDIGKGSAEVKHQKFKALPDHHPGKKASLTDAKDLHKKLAAHYSDSFNKLDHGKKTEFLRKMVDAEKQPTIKPYRANYDSKRKKSHISNPTEAFDEHHKTVKHYSSEHVGASFNIYAHHHDGTKRKVTSIGIKNKQSSPYKGLGGRVGDVSTHK